MDTKAIKDLLRQEKYDDAGDLWMNSTDSPPSPAEIQEILSSLVKADQSETAETLALSLLEACEAMSDDEKLEISRPTLLAVPKSNELRQITADLYKSVNGSKEDFEVIWLAAGLDKNQPPVRALRTLDTCLDLKPGTYMGDCYDDRVIRIERLSPVGYYEYTEDDDESDIEPKELADSFKVLAEDDIRLLLLKNPDRVRELVEKDILALLTGMANAKGGDCDLDTLKETIVPDFLKGGEWSKWWTRARNVIKKSPHLTLEGKNPGTIKYHEGGISPEEEFAPLFEEARKPEELLDVCKKYVSATEKRGAELSEEFCSKIIESMARKTSNLIDRSAENSLDALLMVHEAIKLGCPKPEIELLEPQELLTLADDPAEMVNEISDKPRRHTALELLKQIPDSGDRLEKLLHLASCEHIEEIVAALVEAGKEDVVARAISEAVSNPISHVDICAWIWIGSKAATCPEPDMLNLLLKLLEAMVDVDHSPRLKAEQKKDFRAKVRKALASSNYARFSAILEQIDEQIAAVIKNRIERTEGLAQTVNEKLIFLLSDKFYSLFAEKKVDPWEDKNVLWSTEEALQKQHEILRHIKEVEMSENADRIGEAASFGDLSENAEWTAAVEERDMLAARARKMSDELAIAKAIEPQDILKDAVGIGSRVSLRRDDGESFDISFLGPWDSDPDNRIYPYTTPLAASLMGKKPGTKVMLTLDGSENEYEITDVNSAIDF